MSDDAVIDLGKAGKAEPYNKESAMPYWKKFVNIPNILILVSLILIIVYFFSISHSDFSSKNSSVNDLENSSANEANDLATSSNNDLENSSMNQSPEVQVINPYLNKNQSIVDSGFINTAPISPNKSKLLEINYFYDSFNCSSCMEGKSYLENLKNNNYLVKLNLYETYYDPDNKDLLERFSADYSVQTQVTTPTTFIAEKYFSGFSNGVGSDIQVYVDELTSNK